MYSAAHKKLIYLALLFHTVGMLWAATSEYPSPFRLLAIKQNGTYIFALCVYQDQTETSIPRSILFLTRIKHPIWINAGSVPDIDGCSCFIDLSGFANNVFVLAMDGHYATYDIGQKKWREGDISKEAGNQTKSSDGYMAVASCDGNIVTSCFSAEATVSPLKWQRLPFGANNSKIIVRDRHVFMVNDGEAHNAPLTIWQSSDCGRNWKPFVRIAENDKRIGNPDLMSRVHIGSLDVVGDRFWLGGCHGQADPNVLLIGEGKRLWVRRFPRMARAGYALTDIAFWDKRRGLLNFNGHLFFSENGGLGWREIYDGSLAYARMLLLGPGEALIPMESDRAFKVLWIHDYGKSMQVQTVGTLDDKQPTQPGKGRKR